MSYFGFVTRQEKMHIEQAICLVLDLLLLPTQLHSEFVIDHMGDTRNCW